MDTEEECNFQPCKPQENKFTFWTILGGFLNENKLMFCLFLGILIAVPFKDILLPHLIGKLYSAVKDSSKTSNLYMYITIIIAIVIFIQIVFIISDYIRSLMLPMIQKYIRETMIRHIIETKSTNHDEVRIGIVISTLMKLPINIYNIVDKWRYSYIPAFVTLSFALLYFLWIDLVLGGLLTIVITIFCWVIYNTFTSCQEASVERDRLYNTTHDIVDDVLRNMTMVTSNNTLEAEFSEMNSVHNRYTIKTKETMVCTLTGKYIVISSVIVYFIFLSWYCYKVKKLNAEKFITVLIIMFVVINTILNVTTSLNDTLLKWGIIQNSMTVFELCEPVLTPYNKEARVKKGIVLQDVYFTYENKREVFKNINITIPIGKVTIIEGDNGSGKSTLIRLLLKYHRPQCGEIFINGVPYSKIDHESIRKFISYIPQMPILLNRTVFQNVAYGHEKITREQVTELINKLSLGHFLASLPNGLDTEVGVYGSYLSGGQRQVIWILKTMLAKPLVIIMDEPTASIDEDNKVLVVNLLKRMMNEGNTVIMVTHDPVFKEENKDVQNQHYFISI